MRLLDEVTPERREKILARADELIRAERAGRSAPVMNKNVAVVAVCVVIGAVLGVALLVATLVF